MFNIAFILKSRWFHHWSLFLQGCKSQWKRKVYRIKKRSWWCPWSSIDSRNLTFSSHRRTDIKNSGFTNLHPLSNVSFFFHTWSWSMIKQILFLKFPIWIWYKHTSWYHVILTKKSGMHGTANFGIIAQWHKLRSYLHSFLRTHHSYFNYYL